MMTQTSVNVGIIGCGNISDIYLQSDKKFAIMKIVACADLDMDRARAKAAQYGLEARAPADLLADPEIAIVINLTVPQAHASVGLAALEAGKHVYNEKPLAIERADARRMLDLAALNGLRVAAATFGVGARHTTALIVLVLGVTTVVTALAGWAILA